MGQENGRRQQEESYKDDEEEAKEKTEDEEEPKKHFHIEWPDLIVKQSEQNDGRVGLGVFAARDFKPWECLPILGLALKKSANNVLEKLGLHTHITDTKGGYIDGHPRHQPWKDIGGRGAFISSLINEPTWKKPNLIQRGNHVIVAMPIKAGQELLVGYGSAYVRHYAVSKSALSKQSYPTLKSAT